MTTPPDFKRRTLVKALAVSSLIPDPGQQPDRLLQWLEQFGFPEYHACRF